MFGKTLLGMVFGGINMPGRHAEMASPAFSAIQVREEFVTQRVWDGQSERIEIIGKRACQSRHGISQRLTSRGKGGKQAHRFTGIAAARRAARKGR